MKTNERQNDSWSLEASVLGSLLIDPEPVAPLILKELAAEDFQDPVLRHIFEAAWALYTRMEPVDAVTVVHEAGAAYEDTVRQIMLQTPTAAHAEIYAKQLRETSRLRALRKAAMAVVDAANLNDAIEAAGALNGTLASIPRGRAASYEEMVYAYLDRQQSKTPPVALDWGLQQITEIAPLRPGRFVVVGADSSVGKTAFALQAAYHIARSGKRVAFYSYETSLEDGEDRLMANAADVPLPRSKAQQLTRSDLARVTGEIQREGKTPLRMVESAGYTVGELRTDIVANRIQVAFIDYVQLIPGKDDSRWETVTRTSMELHTMAQQLGCTIVALSQVTLPQAGKGQKVRPTIDKHSLRESRQLTNDADLILLLDLADPSFPSGPRVLKVAKNKEGRLGGMYLDFDPEHMRFSPGRPPTQTGEPVPEKFQQTKLEELPDTGEPLPF